MHRIFVAATLTGLGACASLPETDELLAEVHQWSDTVIAASEHDPQPPDLADATPQQLQFARRVNMLDTALSGRPLVAGNKVTLLVDGPATHDAQLAEIANARDHIHINIYILSSDEVGRRYLDALTRRAAAGVKVRLMYDAYGGRGVDADFLESIEKAGIDLHAYGSVNPADPQEWRLSRRMHRKLLIVDGRVAFTGGINISDQYSVSPGASIVRAGWRDTNIRIDGPAVAEFQRIFLQSWEREAGPLDSPDACFPSISPKGHDLVRAVLRNGEDLSDPLLGPFSQRAQQRDSNAQTEHPIYASYLVAMAEAQQRIWITQAYFIPNGSLLEILGDAAARGVDVRLLLPGYTDIGMMRHAAHAYYDDLLRAGVRVYEYAEPEAVLHAKTAVIDGIWSTVGSSNLDYRSFIHNDEANAIVISQDFAGSMERMFLHDLSHAREITADEWSQRSPWQRLLERVAITFKYWI